MKGERYIGDVTICFLKVSDVKDNEKKTVHLSVRLTRDFYDEVMLALKKSGYPTFNKLIIALLCEKFNLKNQKLKK